MLIPVFWQTGFSVVENQFQAGFHRNLNFKPSKTLFSLVALFDCLTKTFVNTHH